MNSDKITRYGEALLLWILCTVCTSVSVYIYMGTVINVWSVLGALIPLAVILLADFLRKKKLGGLIYAGIFVCVGLIPTFTLSDVNDFSDFIRWFFSGSEAVETRTSFIFTLTVMMSFMFTSAAYYFTKLIYRSSVVILITLIPFALAVKTLTRLPDGYAVIAAAVNAIFFVFYSRKAITEGAVPKGKSTLVVYTDFTVAVILLALLIPKPSVAPYYEKFEELTSRFQFGGTDESSYIGRYKNSSGVTDDLRRGESVLLYSVNTPSPVYTKTQVFDIYDAEKGAWFEVDEMLGSKKWQENAPLLSYEKLGAAAENVYGGEEFAQYYDVVETESYATIYTHNYPAVYVLAPLRATELLLSNVRAEYNARTPEGEIFTNNRLLPVDANYRLSFYTEDIFSRLIANGACDTTAEKFGLDLSAVLDSCEEDTEDYKVAKQFCNMHYNAMEYAGKTVTDVSPEIQALADEITAGLEYDYQKAAAIEQYFHGNGFRYDLMYEPPEESDTPEYFIFESKTGICSDYATAYTLLARAAGLTVRYVEGFVMQPSETTPYLHFIYTDNAHAYPEVYVPGAGWMVFEPTPASIISSGSENDDDDNRTDPWAVLFTAIIAVVVIGIFIVLALVAPKIMEAFFRIRVKLSDNNRAVIMLYNRHAANMERKFEISCKPLTPEQLDTCTVEKTLLTLEPLTKPFVKACYGGMKVEESEKTEAFECYKKQYKAIRKIKKRKE